MILRPTVFPGAVVVSSDLTLRTFHTPKPQLTRMTDPCCDVANLLTPDRFWKSVDRRGRYFAGLARVCRAHPGRGRPIVCPVKRTQRGIIPWRVTYTAAKPNRAGWIAYEYLAGIHATIVNVNDPWSKIRFLDWERANDDGNEIVHFAQEMI